VNFGISPTASFNYNQLDDYTVQFSCTEPNADSWYWDFGSGNFSTIENPQFDFLYDAIWPVKLIISNECGTDTLNEDVSVIKNGINSIQNQTFSIQQLDGNLFIKSLYPMEFSIYTIQGQLIERKNANAFENQILEIPISHFSAGLYILNFTTTEYQTSIKWIKH
jgi:PKD repeat protein